MTESPAVLPSRLTDLLDRIHRMTRGLQYAHGLNPAQWDALRYVARANSYSRTPGALAQFLGTTKGTASQTIAALEKKGLLTRRSDPEDKRVRRIVLTEEGEALLARDPLNCLDQAVRKLPNDVADVVAVGLGQLSRDLQDRCGGSDVGICFQCGHFAGPASDGGARCGFKQADIPMTETRKLCVNFSAEAAADKA
jgi:DNA-binding MarR family transcriptional regulator